MVERRKNNQRATDKTIPKIKRQNREAKARKVRKTKATEEAAGKRGDKKGAAPTIRQSQSNSQSKNAFSIS